MRAVAAVDTGDGHAVGPTDAADVLVPASVDRGDAHVALQPRLSTVAAAVHPNRIGLGPRHVHRAVRGDVRDCPFDRFIAVPAITRDGVDADGIGPFFGLAVGSAAQDDGAVGLGWAAVEVKLRPAGQQGGAVGAHRRPFLVLVFAAVQTHSRALVPAFARFFGTLDDNAVEQRFRAPGLAIGIGQMEVVKIFFGRSDNARIAVHPVLGSQRFRIPRPSAVLRHVHPVQDGTGHHVTGVGRTHRNRRLTRLVAVAVSVKNQHVVRGPLGLNQRAYAHRRNGQNTSVLHSEASPPFNSACTAS